jgi:hypothetical protein
VLPPRTLVHPRAPSCTLVHEVYVSPRAPSTPWLTHNSSEGVPDSWQMLLARLTLPCNRYAALH